VNSRPITTSSGKSRRTPFSAAFPIISDAYADLILLQKGFPDSNALCPDESEGIPPPMMIVSALSRRFVNDPHFVRNFRAAENHDEGMLRVIQRAAHDGEFLLH
jgi:hypothetical protein